MADEFRHAGIGIDLNLEGFQQLIQMNQEVDKVIGSLKDVVNITQQVDFSINKMSSQAANHISKVTDSFKETIATNRILQDDVKKTQSSINDVKTDSVMKLNRAFKDTTESVNNMQKTVADAKKVVNDIPTGGVDKLKQSFNETSDSVHNFGKKTEDSEHKMGHFRDTALGTFAGNALQSGLSSLTSGLEGAVKQGLAFNAASSDIKEQWKQIGLTDNQTDTMVNQIAAIRQHADISAASITNLQKQYLTLTGGNVEQAAALTNTVTSFGKASGMNDQQMTGVNRLISSNNKVNARTFQRSFGQSPEFANEIIKETGMSKTAFNSLLQSGKITGQELRNAMIKASSDSNKAWADYANTTTGRMDMIKQTVNNTKKIFDTTLTAGLFNALKKEAGNSSELNKMQKNVQDIAKNVGTTLGQTIGSVVGFLTKNAKPLSEIGGSLWNIVKALASGVWSSISGILGIFSSNSKKASGGLKDVAGGLTNISKHTTAIKAFGEVLVTAFAAKKIYDFGSSIGTGISAVKTYIGTVQTAAKSQGLFNAVMDANPFGLIVLGITAVIAIVIELYKHFKPVREALNAVGGWFKDAFSVAIKWVKETSAGIAKQFGNLFKDIKSIGKNAWNWIKDFMRIWKDIFTFNFKDLGKVIPKYFSDMWKTLKDLGKAAYDYLNDLTGGKLGEMVKFFQNTFDEITQVWHDAWNGIGHFFEGIWDWIKKIVADGINNVLNVINFGIKAIDGAISMFGGSSQAIKPLQLVHFAEGTGFFDEQQPSGRRRPINHPTFAMLNDGNDSPETGNKEMVIHPNGVSELIHGQNTKRLLEPGAEVLNASETKMIMQMQGIQHFAKGTGFLGKIIGGAEHAASSVWHGATDMVKSIAGKLKFAKNLVKGPVGWVESLFKQPKEKGDILTELGSGMFKAPINAAKSWITELSKMMSGAMNGGGGGSSDLLSAVEKYGRGKRYVWGATGPDAFDCSGLVQYALEHAFGIHYPRTSGQQIATGQRVSENDAQPGDLVGNAGHIGVYAGGGRYWAAASPDSSPNIGMWPVSAFPDGPHYYARVNGIKSKSSSNAKHENSMERLIKSQTGGMLGWIAKHLAPLLSSSSSGGDGSSPNGVMSKSDFNKTAQQAASIMHETLSSNDLAKLYWQAFDESTVNPAVGGGINDHDGTGLPYGLFQYKMSTWNAYALNGHKNIHSALDQDLAVLNDRNWRSDIAPAGVGNRSGWSPTGGRARRNGGPVQKDHWYQVNEEGFEMFKPKTDGKIINHNDSKKIINNSKRPIHIEAPLTINYQGGKRDEDLDRKLSQAFNQHTRMLAEKIAQEFGVDIDEGGMYPL